MIECNNLSKTYFVKQKQPGLMGSIKGLFSSKHEAKHALKNASFEVKKGEIVGLIGSNGAGKTTLVKLLSGIMEPTSGSAHVLGYNPWNRETQFKKNISVIMGQKAQLWWDLPAEDCFSLLQKIYEIPVHQFGEMKKNLVEALGVQGQMRTPIRRLSLGERMKMELIAALLHSPQVIYLDEPTIGLDVAAQSSVRKFLKHYQQENSPAMILTSHYMDDIESLCKRVIVMRFGEIIYDGLLSQIQSNFSAKKRIVFSTKEPLENSLFFLESAFDKKILGENKYSIECERKNLSEIVSWVFSHFEVSDLSIEEQDLSEVIEKILKGEKTL